ncbi:MAG: hypothetical protein JWR69_1856 [Pedosphaera sp.]|nr:hypothetical protein [Pedosphaera sp.]
MHKAPQRPSFYRRTATALSQFEFRTAIATNCFVLAVLLLEIGLGFLSPSTGWFLLPTALAGMAVWLGSRGMQVVATMLLVTCLLVGAIRCYHHPRASRRHSSAELLWIK